MGQGTVANAKSAARKELEQAKEILKDLEKGRDKALAEHEYFTSGEEHTGERDADFDVPAPNC